MTDRLAALIAQWRRQACALDFGAERILEGVLHAPRAAGYASACRSCADELEALIAESSRLLDSKKEHEDSEARSSPRKVIP